MEAIAHVFVDEHGTPRTVNGKVKVRMIGERYTLAGAAPDEIAAQYEISLGDVHGALAYYFDNLAAFEQHQRENETLMEQNAQSGKELLDKWKKRQS